VYQLEWIKAEWKDSGLLQFILSDEKEEAGEKVAEEVVKTHYDVELTSLDLAQKIKIIKALREIFNLGLK
jgi:ribosomal protein L7/L12